MSEVKIKSALISVFYKDGLAPIVEKLNELGVKLYSTGGTQKFIEDMNVAVTPVEDITEYPSIFGGRVKTLHPKIFGGILHRRDYEGDQKEKEQFEIPAIDLVIVDLYPFEETVASGASEEDIIEKIDIGGIALIRGAAKNFQDVLIVSSRNYYGDLLDLLNNKNGNTELADRKLFATRAFDTSSHYDSAIFTYMNRDNSVPSFKVSGANGKVLRYGENPHQQGVFYEESESYFDQIHGKEISYNNLVDIEAAIQLIGEFKDETAFAILKHNNACGVATGNDVKTAYQKAFAADTISAFGGVLICNQEITKEAAEEMHSLFFEILIAPAFSDEALTVLQQKKNRILLVQKKSWNREKIHKSMLNGTLVQDYDNITDNEEHLKVVTKVAPSTEDVKSLLFASKVCKQSKSNTIILAKDGQLYASGVGQTSRVDALEQAIAKAQKFGFDLQGAVMASDAFFPFPDCVEIADKAGIKAVIQPGGSVKDQLSIDYCDQNGMSMVFTGTRHFKH
ncbi:bifunctional phosphoribosylaminoimidazolecarboxamide formyltransferase/IMP cyclohydrolase [Marinoscillum sp. 108]|uniref:bifunctional phosphoribosylaminoimidazolecarboxamide formyltransferase/IMP cyclohydrolase n=1 Tax=Marinoscillum sp. 108 TaxID=2653151 RepID=UPI0012F2C440|nr:bifunctional phosphoribosylaminoimidazolecarboxamide formyltransferase/IMP cyclohydrolase [Marinoscillum sp. 108]VXD19048.1 Phosphoribosylaminoimidazolecarboxamide formyltransferase / IMP cyclohydrolase [Marinoscillum sp. 108]